MPGLLIHSPADILRYALVDLGLGTIPSENGLWPIFVSVEPDTPDNCITLYDTTGIHQGRRQVDGRVLDRAGIQIRVRSSSHVVGYTKANAIAIAVDEDIYLTNTTVNLVTYQIWAISRDSGGILALGKQTPNSKRDLFTVNVNMSVKQLV